MSCRSMKSCANRRTRNCLFNATVAAAAALAAMSPTGASASPLRFAETVMTGLANPRGLIIGPDGTLYVAEAGSGGSGPTIFSGDGFTVLGYGTTGAISSYAGGVQQKVVTGLPSFAPTGGAEAHGVQDLAFGADGRLYATVGWAAIPASSTIRTSTRCPNPPSPARSR